MNISSLKNGILYGGAIGFTLFLFFFLTTSSWIGYSVKSKCQWAEEKYGGTCVEALIQTFQDEENSLHIQNGSTWALGQMGDDTALPVLKEYFTDVPNHREPYNEVLSQYELSKAIKLLEGRFNISAFVWR